MKLIDGDALKAKFCNHCDERDCKPDATDTVYGCVIADTIDNMPTIEAEPVNGWISVKDRLPEYDKTVLVVNEDGYMHTAVRIRCMKRTVTANEFNKTP